MSDWPDEPMNECEEVQEHRGAHLRDDTDGVLIYECTVCGAEWIEDE